MRSYAYKFRTMTDAQDKNGKLLPDEVRLTSFGGAVPVPLMNSRAWNILRGDMSWGQATLWVSASATKNRDVGMKSPGLGLAQVSGRMQLAGTKSSVRTSSI